MPDHPPLHAQATPAAVDQISRDSSIFTGSDRAKTPSIISKPGSLRPESDDASSRYNRSTEMEHKGAVEESEFGLYKRRWLGLAQLTLLNLAVGWGFAAPGVVALTAVLWFDITFETLNWLSISSSLVFLIPAPFTIWILNKWGPKFSINLACVLAVIGNWIIYAADRQHNFTMHIAGTIIYSLATPFILAAPTRYSRQWFDDKGRTLATALPSLAYPLGAGIGSLSGPHMVKPLGPLNYDGQALVIAIIFTVAALPAPFLPSAPPKPPSVVAAVDKLGIWDSIKSLAKNPAFHLQFISFTVFAGSIDTLIAVTYQSIFPYGFPQVDAGYAIACLIFVGVGVSLIISPILDRTKGHLIALKIISVIIAVSFTAVPFIPQTRNVKALYAVYAITGAAALSVEPCVLEFQAAWTHPVSPEFSSVMCWCGAKVGGAIFTIIVGRGLVSKKPHDGQPALSLFNGMIFLVVICWLCVPLALMTGVWKFKRTTASKVEGNE